MMYVKRMQQVEVKSVFLLVLHEKLLIDFDEILYEYLATGGHSEMVVFAFLHWLVTTR